MFSFLFQRIAANRLSDQKLRARRNKSTSIHRSRTLGIGMECLEHRTLLSATTMEVEPNNNAATATIAQFDPADGAAQLAGSIANRKDRDFFQFTAPSSGSVQLAVHGDPGLVTKVEVENSHRDEVFETEPHDGIDSGSFAVEAGQTYTLRVEGKDKTIGAYTVDLVLSNDAPPANGGADEQNEDGPNDRNHYAVDDHGQRHGGHGADDVVAAVATTASKRGGADDPANHDAVDDRGQRHGGHGADDVVAAVATSASKRGGADDPANHDAVDDRLTVALATPAAKVDDHGADRQNDRGN